MLCEKPLEVTVARASVWSRRAARRSSAGDLLQHRFRPASQRLHAVLESGALGEVQAATLIVPWWRPQSYYDEPGRGVLARDGGGVLMTQAIYSIDLFRWLVGIDLVEAAQVRHDRAAPDGDRGLRLGAACDWAMVPRHDRGDSRGFPGSPEFMHDHRLERDGAAGWRQPPAAFVRWAEEVLPRSSGGTGSGAGVMAFSHEAHRRCWPIVSMRSSRVAIRRSPGEEALATQRVIDAILDRGKAK